MNISLPSPSRIMSSLFPSTSPTTAQGASAGAELCTADGRALPLIATTLRAEAKGGLARFVLEQTFRNAYAERLHVTYRMPLPADGAVSGYAFVIGERTITGVVDKKHAARERFEQAVASGNTAGLLEQERQDIFTQLLGNVPPNETIVAKITVDAKLAWLPEGEWELRFPTVIGPRYIGMADSISDAQATHVKVSPQPLAVTVQLALAIGDAAGGRRASSPTHVIERASDGSFTLAAGARLDRDLVVRWPVATPTPGLSLATARPSAGDESFGLLTIVPPARAAKTTPIARDLIVLLDTSGSMGGHPLDKAKAVVAMLIDTLTERDRFELIEFNARPTRYKEEPEAATPEAKRAALRWVKSREADGGTEMREGVLEALRTLRIGAQRQIVVVTDGYVGGEQQILQALNEKLPRSCRLHVLGCGDAVNRSLATSLARAGRGVEIIVGVSEDPERGAKRLLDRTALPMLTNVTISGDALIATAPEQLPDVFEGAPLVAALALSTEGGELVVRGETADGPWEERTRVLPLRAGEGNQAICALYGRERVADLEARALLEEPKLAVEAIGLRFQIATRFTSWIAVDESRVHVGPDSTQNVPQEVPHGARAQAFGLRAAGTGPIARSLQQEGDAFAPRSMSVPAPRSYAPRAPMSYASPPPGAPRGRVASPPASLRTGYVAPVRDNEQEEFSDEPTGEAVPVYRPEEMSRATRMPVTMQKPVVSPSSEPVAAASSPPTDATFGIALDGAPADHGPTGGASPVSVPAPVARPASSWRWLVLAMIIAIIAALVWWLAS